MRKTDATARSLSMVKRVTRPSDSRDHRSLHGLTRSLLNNMVIGVNDGYLKVLRIEGVGYRALMEGKTLVFMNSNNHQLHLIDVMKLNRNIIIKYVQ